MCKKSVKYAGIDIGSNAVRLVVNEIFPGNTFQDSVLNKLTFLRLPLRLGGDVFLDGAIGEKKIAELIRAMKIYKELMKFYEVDKFRACATSATRSASNSKSVIKKVEKETGIKIEVISGEEEAMLIYKTNKYNLPEGNIFLSADLGGGSIQLTLFKGNEVLSTNSYEIGTVRMINNIVKKSELQKYEKKIAEYSEKYENIKILGTGGNINKISKMIGKKYPEISDIEKLYKELSSVSLIERMNKFDLRDDRADVILPAAEVYIKLLKTLKADKIYVPKVGLADGIIRQIFENNFNAGRNGNK